VIKALIKEPVVQCLAIGALLFAAYSIFGPKEDSADKQFVVVSTALVESLEASFRATWQRPPTADEREGLIQDYIAEEILYREARKLGLDQDDTVIRRRLRQKMEFLLQDSLAAPGEPELVIYFEENKARYTTADSYAFNQIFLGATASTVQQQEWQALAKSLNDGGAVSLEALAQPTLLPESMPLTPAPAIERVFGASFTASLEGLERGRWHGPIQSAYGWHLLRLDRSAGGELPAFESVRGLVERDVIYERQKGAQAELIERLKQGYEITVERPGT